MAVYKVIQDIEAEDKLLGPLTLKSFIYAAIAGVCAFINFKLLFIGTPLKWIFILMFLGPMVLFGVLASPLGRDQPTEVWLLSRIKFFFKPRKRLWDQEGMSQLVTVTAPKKVEVQLTKDLTPNEVQSRLKTLALTLDTRGWAIKNVNVNLNTEPEAVAGPAADSDRLIQPTSIKGAAQEVDVNAADDILDEKNNPTAKKFNSMMLAAEKERKHGILGALKDAMDSPAKNNSENTKDLPATKAALARASAQSESRQAHRIAKEEDELERRLAEARLKFATQFAKRGHKKTSAHPHALSMKKAIKKAKPNTVTAAPQADTMELAQSGSAFSVATLSALANRRSKIQQTGPDEVTISLH